MSIVVQDGKTNFLVRPDFAKDKIDPATNSDHPDWIVYDSDSNNGQCLSFEYTWITSANDKFWGKKWAGGGVAFDNSWALHDFSKAKYLIFSAKTNAPGVDFNLAISGATDGVQTGNVKIGDFAEGKKIGETWTKVVIPLAAFPSLDKVDLTQLKTLRFDLQGEYPENTPVHVYFDKMYFTDSAMVTPVENLGWLKVPGGVQVMWDKANDDGILTYDVSVDGKVVGKVTGAKKRQVKLLNGVFKDTANHVVGVAADNGTKVSAFEAVTLNVAPSPAVSATVAVAATASHSISPYIFGFNYLDGETLKKAGGTVNRWGGNATTNYNWKEDADNKGQDWYYLNSAGAYATEKDKRYAKAITDAFSAGSQMIITIPNIDWVAKAPPLGGKELASFPVALYPGQTGNDGQGSGNGLLAGGKKVWGNDPNANYVPNSPAFQEEWVKTIVQNYGLSTQGGVKFYQMDNEPGLWNENHRDVCPKGIGFDDLVNNNAKYAAAVKDADPNAQVIGFTAWGVMELAGSDWDGMPGGVQGYQNKDGAGEKWTDRKAHGGITQLEYYLREMNKRSQLAGKRLIDYVDNHGFPEVYGTDAKGNKVNILRVDCDYDPLITPQQFEAMRIFWDPTFTSPDSWCANTGNKPYLWDPWVGLIPKLKKIIADNYPGTKLSMTEYYPTDTNYFTGALLEAVNLGIFMREGMDMACDWDGTHPGNYVFWGHKLFSDYDDRGSKIGGNYLPATSSSPDLYSFGANDGKKTFVMLINKNHDTAQDTAITLPQAVTRYETYTLAQTSGKRLYDSGPLAATGAGLTLEVPAFSAILLVAE